MISPECFVCSEHHSKKFLTVNDYQINKCYHCGFIFVHPRPDEKTLFELYNDKNRNIYAHDSYHELRYELNTLKKLMADIKKIIPVGDLLEIGCGRGDFLKIAQKNGYEVQGVDLSGAKSPYKDIQIHEGRLADGIFSSERFDLVVMRNLLEHAIDPILELREVSRVLKPHGIMYLKVPNVEFEYGWRRKIVFGGGNSFAPPWHLNHFSPTTLRRLLSKNGFKMLTWVSEFPTARATAIKNIYQYAGFYLLEGIRHLSFGLFHPRVTLGCITKKIN